MINQYVIGESAELLSQIDSGSVDLIYGDPPYNTGRDFFHFSDRFTSIEDYRDKLMLPILRECKRVLKPTGNIVIHIEPRISHHIRFMLDEVFGSSKYVNEVAWVSGGNHHSTKQMQRNHDTLLIYKNGTTSFYQPEYLPYRQEDIDKAKICSVRKEPYTTSALVNRQADVIQRPNLRYEWNGNYEQWWVSKEKMQQLHDDSRLEYSANTGIPRVKKYYSEMRGIPIKDVWSDIKQIQAPEKLDYATQKPVKLLERVVNMFSPEGGVVLDPFAGSGTTGRACIKTNRDFILLDINDDGKKLFESSIDIAVVA